MVIALFAGHGLVKDNQQHVVINEFDVRTGYYRLFNVEKVLRGYARDHNNTYVIGINACCRSIYHDAVMKGTGCTQLRNIKKNLFKNSKSKAKQPVKVIPTNS